MCENVFSSYFFRYYGQLFKDEIKELYLLYKLDFQLFGYSPNEYIAMGKDRP